jgi:hypothetical protein
LSRLAVRDQMRCCAHAQVSCVDSCTAPITTPYPRAIRASLGQDPGPVMRGDHIEQAIGIRGHASGAGGSAETGQGFRSLPRPAGAAGSHGQSAQRQGLGPQRDHLPVRQGQQRASGRQRAANHDRTCAVGSTSPILTAGPNSTAPPGAGLLMPGNPGPGESSTARWCRGRWPGPG